MILSLKNPYTADLPEIQLWRKSPLSFHYSGLPLTLKCLKLSFVLSESMRGQKSLMRTERLVPLRLRFSANKKLCFRIIDSLLRFSSSIANRLRSCLRLSTPLRPESCKYRRRFLQNNFLLLPQLTQDGKMKTLNLSASSSWDITFRQGDDECLQRQGIRRLRFPGGVSWPRIVYI